MKTVFPYGDWVWLVLAERSNITQCEGFIIAESQHKALEIVKKDLIREYDTSFEVVNDVIIGGPNNTAVRFFVEPAYCLNPEVCGN